MAGDVSVNIGIFVAAILARPNVSLPSKYALVMTEAVTCKYMIIAWAEATGKDTAYNQVSLQAFDSLWPKFGGEMAAQLQWARLLTTGRLWRRGFCRQRISRLMRMSWWAWNLIWKGRKNSSSKTPQFSRDRSARRIDGVVRLDSAPLTSHCGNSVAFQVYSLPKL